MTYCAPKAPQAQASKQTRAPQSLGSSASVPNALVDQLDAMVSTESSSQSSPLFLHPIQVKTQLSEERDPPEREAQQLAQQIMQTRSRFAPPSQSTDESIPTRQRSGGEPLPGPFRFFLESALNAALGDIRVFTTPEAHQMTVDMGAIAVTEGQDIAFRAGEYNPNTYAGQTLVTHEVIHALQQTPELSKTEALSVTPIGCHDAHLQRALHVGEHQFFTAEEAYSAMYFNVSPSLEFPAKLAQGLKAGRIEPMKRVRQLLGTHQKEVLKILRQWIELSDHRVVRMAKGQTNRDGIFINHQQMAMTVLGLIESQENLKKETALAKKAIQSKLINQQLNSLIPKMCQQFEDVSSSSIPEQFGKQYKGRYWPWYTLTKGGFSDIFQRPTAHKIPAKIAAIHDLTDFYFNQPKDQPQYRNLAVVPPEKSMASSYIPGQKVPLTDHRFTVKVGDKYRRTLNQDHAAMVAVRLHAKPVEVGPSLTTGRFMQAATCAGATPAELEALAWGLFAFWNQSYTTSASGIHRFHFVMDMASNYGVAYDMCNPIPPHPPTFSEAKAPVETTPQEEGGSSQLEASPIPSQLPQPTEAEVIPPLNINPRTWKAAQGVEQVHGVDDSYKIHGPKDTVILKLVLEPSEGMDQVVGAHLGQMLGVNTVVPEYFEVGDLLLCEGLEYLAICPPDGAKLFSQMKAARAVIAMPDIPGQTLSEAQQDISLGSSEHKEMWGQALGRLFVLDLLLLNRDRHSETVVLGDDQALYATEQTAGAMLRGEMAEFAPEKLAMMLDNLTAVKTRFLRSLLPDLTTDEPSLNQGFQRGMSQSVAKLSQLRGADIDVIYSTLLKERKRNMLPGLENVLPLLTHQRLQL